MAGVTRCCADEMEEDHRTDHASALPTPTVGCRWCSGAHDAEIIAAQLAGFGSRVEVTAPEVARRYLARIGSELAALYPHHRRDESGRSAAVTTCHDSERGP